MKNIYVVVVKETGSIGLKTAFSTKAQAKVMVDIMNFNLKKTFLKYLHDKCFQNILHSI